MILKFNQFNESNRVGSPLLSLQDNVDHELVDLIKNELKIGSKILEISCGNASDSLCLQELGYQVVCTEKNPEYAQNAKDLGLNCLLHDTKNKFPFGNKEFDLVYSRLGLHYFTPKDLEDILSEINRISKRILITIKVVDDIKTGKVILTPDTWREIISKHFQIKKFEVKEGLLYDSQSGWIEILADSVESKLEKIDVGRFENSSCIQVMEHELDAWRETHKLESFSYGELDEIESMFKDFDVVDVICSKNSISYKYESKQRSKSPKVMGIRDPYQFTHPIIKIKGKIHKFSDEYYRVTLGEHIYDKKRNVIQESDEYYICDQFEGLKLFKKVLENKIKYLKKDLSVNESTGNSFPEKISHSDALSFVSKKEGEIKFSDYQIEKIKGLIPEDHQLEVEQGGQWYDLDKKLYRTSVIIHKNNFNKVNIRTLEDDYFMIQVIRESKRFDYWWLCDGFEQVIEWLKSKY